MRSNHQAMPKKINNPVMSTGAVGAGLATAAGSNLDRAAGRVNNVSVNQDSFRLAPITGKGGNIFYDGENDDAGQHLFDRYSRHKFLADTAED
jgi:hypothetical protein